MAILSNWRSAVVAERCSPTGPGSMADIRLESRAPKTLAALGKVGRMPTSSEQALAICCEIGAVNYVETSSLPGTIS